MCVCVSLHFCAGAYEAQFVRSLGAGDYRLIVSHLTCAEYSIRAVHTLKQLTLSPSPELLTLTLPSVACV